MDPEKKEAAGILGRSGLVATLLALVLGGNLGGLGESLNTVIVNLAGQYPKPFWIGVCVLGFLMWNANALRKTYPDTATRPRWITYLMYLLPTMPPPKPPAGNP